MSESEFSRIIESEIWRAEMEMGMHREVTRNGVDPDVRRAVLRSIVMLAGVAALIWAYLLLNGMVIMESGVGVISEQMVTEPVEYSAQGWPTVRAESGNVMHPEDLGRQGCGG